MERASDTVNMRLGPVSRRTRAWLESTLNHQLKGLGLSTSGRELCLAWYDTKLRCSDITFLFHYFCRNAATKTIKQELLFVGSEYGKLVALREIIQKVLNSFMTF